MTTLLRSDSTWKCLGYPSSALSSVPSLIRSMDAFLSTTQLALNMTSNTTPSPYVASASSSYNSNYYPWRAFDGTTSSYCWVTAAGQTTGWIALDLGTGNEKYIVQYGITSRNEASSGSAASPRDWTFEGSNDGVNWVVLDTRANESGWAVNETRIYKVTTLPGSFRHYRLNISANNGYSYLAVGEILLFVSPFLLSSVTLSESGLQLATAPGSGECISPPLSLYSLRATGTPVISWDGSTTGVTCDVDISTDSGTTWLGWQPVSNGGALPGVDQTTNLDTVRFRYRLTLVSETDVSPVVSNVHLENIADWLNVPYDDSSWSAVYDNGAYGISPWSTNVSGWPDSAARWVWDRASTSSAPAGDVYFRKKFTLAESKWITVAFACDDKAELYVDGQYLLGRAGYTSVSGNSIYLPAGEHVIAIKGTNNAAGAAGLLVTVRDAFAGLAGGGAQTGLRQVRSFSGLKLEEPTLGLRQERNLTANVYVVDIFNTGPPTRKVGDYFLGVRASIDQEAPPPQPPSGGGETTAPVRRFPFSWFPFVHQRWRPTGTA